MAEMIPSSFASGGSQVDCPGKPGTLRIFMANFDPGFYLVKWAFKRCRKNSPMPNIKTSYQMKSLVNLMKYSKNSKR